MQMPDTAHRHSQRTLLLLAGPSGAGKSTFIEHLKRRILPAELQVALDPFRSAGRVVEITNKLRRSIQMQGFSNVEQCLSEVSSLIIHYDIASVHRFNFGDYDRDPGLRLVEAGNPIVFVSILPEQSRLVRQFENRAQLRLARKGALHRFWRLHINRRLRQASLSAGLSKARLEQDLYRSKDWVDECYREWRSFVSAATSKHPNATAYYVEPCFGLKGTYSFRVLAHD